MIFEIAIKYFRSTIRMTSHNRILGWSVRFLLFIGCVYYLFYHIRADVSNVALLSHFTFLNSKKIILFASVFLLMPINWFVEALKWKYLIRNLCTTSIRQAINTVMVGVFFGIFTPARIGEVFGRSLYQAKGSRGAALMASIAGSLCQAFATMIFGVLGFVVFYFFGYATLYDVFGGLLGISVVIMAFALVFLGGLKWLGARVLKKKWIKKYWAGVRVWKYFGVDELFVVQIFSFGRYLVFSLQYFFLLMFFDVDVGVLPGFAAIGIVFFVLSFVPSNLLVELGIRGAVSVYVFGHICTSVDGVLWASSILWFINVGLPALFGAVVFNLAKLKKSSPVLSSNC